MLEFGQSTVLRKYVMSRNDEQTNVRLPAELKSYINDQASAARRSLTAEVVLRLERTRLEDQKAAQQSTTKEGTQ